MSKRHQSSRRKSYGRRQHEVRERVERQPLPGQADLMPDAFDAGARFDDLGFFALVGAGRRLALALGD